MASYAANLTTLEGALVQKLRASEAGAFQEVFHHFGQRVFRTALKILHEEESAKDAVQETMINVYRSASSFRGESKLSTWINRIAVNVCLEMIRKNKKHSHRTDEDISEREGLLDVGSQSPYAQFRRKEAQKKVSAALSHLSENHRIVVRMHDLEGFTIKEISERFQVAEGTIKSRLFYGREELRKHLLN